MLASLKSLASILFALAILPILPILPIVSDKYQQGDGMFIAKSYTLKAPASKIGFTTVYVLADCHLNDSRGSLCALLSLRVNLVDVGVYGTWLGSWDEWSRFHLMFSCIAATVLAAYSLCLGIAAVTGLIEKDACGCIWLWAAVFAWAYYAVTVGGGGPSDELKVCAAIAASLGLWDVFGPTISSHALEPKSAYNAAKRSSSQEAPPPSKRPRKQVPTFKSSVEVLGSQTSHRRQMGLFEHQSDIDGAYHNAGYPIYCNTDDQYLYFWSPSNSWRIGPDYNSAASGVSSQDAPSLCPTEASGWKYYVDGSWVEGCITVK